MPHYRILSDAEIRSSLTELPDWSLRAPNIEAKFEFKTFRDAIAFIVEIAIEAEVMNHHPEFHNSYNIVSCDRKAERDARAPPSSADRGK